MENNRPITTNDTIIEVKDLVASYGDRKVLDGVNLSVRHGETMIILGPSGCGKSTLLRHIVGLQKPASGKIYVKDHDISQMTEEELNELRTKMGMLFQGGALFNSMTVGDNVSLSLREHTKLVESTIKIMARLKLGLVGLSGFEDFMPSQLSGGMKKRAGLARAIAMDPEILFFDEPSAGLDPIIAAGIDDLILKLKKAFNMTMVIVTHEMTSAFLIADRITMLYNGKVIAQGSIDDIRANQDPKVRQFLERRADDEAVDSEAYLRELTGR